MSEKMVVGEEEKRVKEKKTQRKAFEGEKGILGRSASLLLFTRPNSAVFTAGRCHIG